MMRETRRADELAAGTYIKYNGYTERVVFAQTVDRRTLLAFADNTHAKVAADDPIDIATDEEGRDHDADRDRERVANALHALANTILNRSLPVPASLRDVKVDFNLDDNADLSGWSEVLRRTPVKHTPSLMPSMSSDELGLDVCITGGTWEFGPDLTEPGDVVVVPHGPVKPPYGSAERAAYDVEHRDAVGAFPVAWPTCRGCGEPHPLNEVGHCVDCETEAVLQAIDEMRAEESAPKPAPVGWPLGDGHRPQVDPEAMTQDRYEKTEGER